MENDQPLTPDEHAVLAFENAGRWKFPAAKAARVREQLGLSETAYYRLLNTAIDKHDARLTYPQMTRRLRSLRDARRRVRSIRRLAG